MPPTAFSLPAPDGFDLASSLHSGQAFQWESPEPGAFLGCIGEAPVLLRQSAAGEPLSVTTPAPPDAVAHYLGLGDDLPAIRATFPAGDRWLDTATAYCPGIRILRQQRWECLASFITSSLKQVAHIRQMSLALRQRYGTRHSIAAHVVFSYPAPGALAAAGEDALRACGLGYRAKSLHRAACAVAEGKVDLEAIAVLDDAAARAALCELHGVGEKIANCVLLFSYGRLGAFPIDVWVERILRELYFKGKRKVTPRRIRAFALQHFGEHRGYAQQFLFHWARGIYTRKDGFNPPPAPPPGPVSGAPASAGARPSP